MARWSRHLSRTLIAGVVAVLPVGGLILVVGLGEATLADTGLGKQAWYVPGMGWVAVLAGTYVIGLFVTTFLGRWLWSQVDGLLSRVPLLGGFYHTLQQILGYGEGKGALFERVVYVPARDVAAEELGLVTQTLPAGEGASVERLVVFVPAAVNPTVGRMLLLDADAVRPAALTVNAALKALVSVGKAGLLPDEDDRDDVPLRQRVRRLREKRSAP